MPIIGYSDRINHALAFAAKHHDRQVRKGTRPPYLTRPANVAIILTRYGRDDEAVVAGILHDVIEDCVHERYGADMLERVSEKFGQDVLQTVIESTTRLVDDDGVDLSFDEGRDDYLARLARATERARWVCAADELHDAGTILADLWRTIDPDTVWGRFPAGRVATIQWYRRVHDRLLEVGFAGEIMRELAVVVVALEQWLGPTAPRQVADAAGQP